MESRATRIGLKVWTLLVVLFLHLPIVIIILYAFNAQAAQGWPITDWTTKWFGRRCTTAKCSRRSGFR
jgi:ABC-type spermidine/putrescine transport system permease subunit II